MGAGAAMRGPRRHVRGRTAAPCPRLPRSSPHAPSPGWRARRQRRAEQRIVSIEILQYRRQARIGRRRCPPGDQEAASILPRSTSGAVGPIESARDLAAPGPWLPPPGSTSPSAVAVGDRAAAFEHVLRLEMRSSRDRAWRRRARSAPDLSWPGHGPTPSTGAGRRCRPASGRRRAARTARWRSDLAGRHRPDRLPAAPVTGHRDRRGR